jgi:DnaJ-class molecular chaperone
MNYYELLGIASSSTVEEITKAYKKLSLIHHPDKSNTEESIKKWDEISKAYKLLLDPEKRAIYDNYGIEGLRENVLEIDLAYKTLAFIGTLQDDELVDVTPQQIRSLSMFFLSL